MKAMIFAAGIGSRLKPWTDYHPKALVEVGGVPMLGRIINNLKKIGVSEISINVHHFAEQIEQYLQVNCNFGVNIHISDERSMLLDTGKGLLKAASFLRGSGPIIVHNADIYCDLNLKQMVECHIQAKADATLYVSQRSTSRVLLFDGEMRLRGWKNNSTGDFLPKDLVGAQYLSPLAFNGIHVISEKILEALAEYDAGVPFSTTPFYVENAGKLIIKGYLPETSPIWYDIGRPETLRECQDKYSKSQ